MIWAVSACTLVPPEEDPVYLKQAELDSRLSRVERVIDNEGLMQLLQEIERLKQENQALRNQVETLQFEVQQSAGRQRDLYVDLDQRLQAMEKSGRSGASVLDGGALQPGELPVPGGSDRANYQAAFEFLKQGRDKEANLALRQFMVAFPESSLQDNAQYWLAETYYKEKDYRTALREFQTVVEKFPQSRKIPDALLKIGYCNYELKRWADARRALSAVVKDYPETTAARLAGQRLDAMTSEGV